ncbi:acyl transferase/acyl hydrolase/lysophospholipase [Phascolomyces articulosus]|uniref:Lysophospholipase n=1 Tax=Phascolomyces articulosus TaxID=60185 RepID=A0AAD5K6I9_9FUNG|nr:acyl transferase/acyl hydrolase/lysophospholipase [Phascolomyces articulosus]
MQKSLVVITAVTVCVIVTLDYQRRRHKRQLQHTTTRQLPSKKKQEELANKEEAPNDDNEQDKQDQEEETNAIETWLIENFQTWQNTSDEFISNIFNNMPEWTTPDWITTPDIPTSLEDWTEKMTQLYPAFESQLESMRETYEQFWNFLSMDEFRKIVEESRREDLDATLHPEITLDAEVRMGTELPDEEEKFRIKRQTWQREAFAKFIGVDPKQVDPRDIPIVGIAASGGGYRAMNGTAGYLKAMHDSGMLDCTMYMAGVSGSTWCMAQLYSRLTHRSFDTLMDHLKSHIHTHIANVSNFMAILQASSQNAKTLIQGLIQRYYQQNGTLNVVDIYGMLLGGTLLTEIQTVAQPRSRGNPSSAKSHKKQEGTEEEYSEKIDRNTEDRTVGDEGLVREEDNTVIRAVLPSKSELKLTRQRHYFEDGSWPMPIYCVVHHEVKDLYRWFEFTPYEMGCEELKAWIPVWSFGRQFKEGKNIEKLPEQTLGTLMGVFGSAFASSLAHFFQEIRAFLPGPALAAVDNTLTQYKNDLLTIHPFSPARFPNPFYKIDNPLSSSSPQQEPSSSDKESVSSKSKDEENDNDPDEEKDKDEKENEKEETTQSLLDREYLDLLDAGCDNNIPFYPLLRRERHVDFIIALDLSADIETAPHLERAQGYTKRRGIDGWPEEARWPDIQPKKDDDEDQNDSSTTQTENSTHPYGLGTCTIFEGSQTTVAYFPLIVNDHYDPEFDPQTADFCSTFSFVYTAAQTTKLVGLGEANWHDNVDQVKQKLKSLWEKKRQQRINS